MSTNAKLVWIEAEIYEQKILQSNLANLEMHNQQWKSIQTLSPHL